MKNNYSIAERNRIVEENLHLIDRVLLRNRRLIKAADREDVYQDLALRLIECVANYDPEMGTLRSQIHTQLQRELDRYKRPRSTKGGALCPQMC